MAVAILYREELKEYDFGPGHPFRGDRYEQFPPFLQKRLPEDDHYRWLAADAATDDDLLKICDQDYINFCRDYYQAVSGGWVSYYDDFDRYLSLDNKPVGIPGQVEKAARLIIGQAKKACDLVQGHHFQKVVSIGGGMHHAKRRFGEGFCIYNDVAFTARYLIENYKLERVMVLDTDAHAGNGTAEYVGSDPRILFVDLHQDPRTIYPGTGFAAQVGIDKGRGHTVNIPLPVFAGDASYRMIFDQIVQPLAQEFQPQILIRNGGSDPHYHDGLTYLGLTIAGFKEMGEKVRAMSAICDGKQIDLIASGYNISILPYAWLSLLSGIADFPINIDEPSDIPRRFQWDHALSETEEVIEEVKRYHQEYWRCFR